MIRLAGNMAAVEGAMTLETAAALLKEGEAAIAKAILIFDLGAVTAMDSSGLAVVFGWMRAASAKGKPLELVNPPENLVSLADVYGVRDLLPAA